MIGFAALLAYISQCEKVNHAYTVSLSFVFLNVPKTLQVKYDMVWISFYSIYSKSNTLLNIIDNLIRIAEN